MNMIALITTRFCLALLQTIASTLAAAMVNRFTLRNFLRRYGVMAMSSSGQLHLSLQHTSQGTARKRSQEKKHTTTMKGRARLQAKSITWYPNMERCRVPLVSAGTISKNFLRTYFPATRLYTRDGYLSPRGTTPISTELMNQLAGMQSARNARKKVKNTRTTTHRKDLYSASK